MRAEVVYAFAAATTDEISLSVGEIVEVLSIHDGGWGYGHLVSQTSHSPSPSLSPATRARGPGGGGGLTGASSSVPVGYFPLSYVDFIRPQKGRKPSAPKTTNTPTPATQAADHSHTHDSEARRPLINRDLSSEGFNERDEHREESPPPPPPAIEIEHPSISSFSDQHESHPLLQVETTPLKSGSSPSLSPIDTGKGPATPQQSVLTPRSPSSVSSFFDLNKSKVSAYKGDLPWAIPFGELTLEDCIGAGGFGAVYRGVWKGEVVAIKKMLFDRKQADQQDQHASLALFQKEAEFLRSFSHENIVEFKGACLDYPNLCLVMEYATNGSLFHYIKRNKGLPPKRMLDWAFQIARGMSYLLNDAPTPIIHRDLKSQNVLVTTNFQLKITDFGVAKVKPLNQSTKMSTAGTFAWMSPEAIKFQNYSEFSDVWSFGVILWELLTGEVPYDGIEPYCIAYGVATRNLKLPVPEACPPPIKNLLEQCWKEERKFRPTFCDICEILESSESQSLSQTPPDTLTLLRSSWTPQILSTFEAIREKERALKEKEEEMMREERERKAQEHALKIQQQVLAKREEDLLVREHLLDFNARKNKVGADRIFKSRSMEIISPPFGFRHVAHVGRTSSEGFGFGLEIPDVEPDWMKIVQLAGISHKQLSDGEWLKFIIDFTLQNSDPKDIIGDLVHEMNGTRNGPFLEFGPTYDELTDELNKRLSLKLSQSLKNNPQLSRGPTTSQEQAMVKAVPNIVTVGEMVKIQWLSPDMGPRDWIAVVPYRSKTNKEQIFRHNTSGDTFGAVIMKATKVGRFDVRLADKSGKTLITGNAFTVKEKMRPRGSTWSSPDLQEDVKRSSSFFG